MATIKFETVIRIDDSRSGSQLLKTTKTITYTKKDQREYSIPANTEQILFNPTVDASESSSDFNFLYIITSDVVELEIECDTDADVGREQIVVTLQPDVPFILGDNASKAGVVAFDGFGGTLDSIDKIVAKAGVNPSNLTIIVAE